VEITGPGSNHQPVITVGKPALTDGNGFYSIEIVLEEVDETLRSLLTIQASCLTSEGLKTTNRWNSTVRLRAGTIRRDLYVEGFSARRAPTHCLIGLTPAGERRSLRR
jgi:hypothetical protein